MSDNRHRDESIISRGSTLLGFFLALAQGPVNRNPLSSLRELRSAFHRNVWPGFHRPWLANIQTTIVSTTLFIIILSLRSPVTW